MTRIDRRRFVQGTGMAGLAALAGCSSSGGTTSGTTVAMVYATGGLGDGSFNDQAQQGLQQAKEEFEITSNNAQPEAIADFSGAQSRFAESTDPDYDLICCIGFLQAEALRQNAPEYPDQNFMIVDSAVESDNVASYVFREHEGSYLVGVLAGMLTQMDFSAGGGQTNTDTASVGFVGGVESDLIGRFQAGYEAGVKSTGSDVEIQTNYVGAFDDPAGGREAAQAMYNNGADVVYHAAGNTGTGVFRAAQDQGRFAIGVDRDQSLTRSSFADVILASMVKRVDTAVFESISNVVDDSFQGGSVTALGLEKDGVDIAYGQTLGSEIPSGVKDEITAAREGIVGGSVSVPTDPENV